LKTKRLLAVYPYLPYPPNYGGKIRSFQLLELLRKRFEIEVVGLTVPEDDPAMVRELGEKVERVFAIPSPPSPCLSRRQKIRNTISPKPWELPLHSEELGRIVHERSVGCDVVFFCSTRLLHLRHRSRGRVHLLDLLDIAHLIAYRRVKSTANLKQRLGLALEFVKTFVYELKGLPMFDMVLVTNDADIYRLRRWNRKLPLAVVPNGVDTEAYSFNPLRSSTPYVLMFLGALDYSPNEVAVEWLCRSILPKIRSVVPQVKVLLVGRNPSRLVRSFVGSGIELVANVPDVRPYFRDCSVFVAPITIGGGTRIKILEAAAAGRPVVSTSVGAEGLSLIAGAEIEIADTENDFARKTLGLLTDRARVERMTTLARRRVEREYTWELSRNKLEQAIAPWL